MHANSHTPRLIALLAVAGLSLPAALAQPGGITNEEIIREGDEDRRQALNEMELTPFPLQSWDLVSDWQFADPPTPESTDGKVVLIMTFSGWYPPSLRSLAVINRMATERAEEGLVVVGVHDAEAWEDGLAAAESRSVSFAVGYDADNLFRHTLMVDQDPDFYLIDRAGQLRFTDVETSSVEAAVDLLLAETRDDAATVIGRIADARLRAEIEARRTRAINQAADLTNVPDVPFVMPGPEAYAAQRWPIPPRDPNNPSAQTPESIARPIAVPREGWWPSPPNPLGRAAVIYFFDRRVSQTIDMIDDMDSLQRRYSRDLNVIGSMSPIFQDNSGQPAPAGGSQDTMHIIRRTYESMGLAHSVVVDPTGALLGAAAGGSTVTFTSNTSGGVAPTLAAVVSSDGIVRWFGDATSHAFESAVAEVARIDPGVRARRQAEDAYLREHPR